MHFLWHKFFITCLNFDCFNHSHHLIKRIIVQTMVPRKDFPLWFLSLASVAISLAGCESKRTGPSPEKYDRGSPVAKIGGPEDSAANANAGRDTMKSKVPGLSAGVMVHD